MDGVFSRAVRIILVLGLLLCMFTACGGPSGGDSADTSAPEETAQTAVPAPMVVSFEVDGGRVTFEDAAGRSVAQLLELAGISLNEGDTLCVVPEQAFPGSVNGRVCQAYQTGGNGYALYLKKDGLAGDSVTLKVYIANGDSAVQALSQTITLSQ